MRSTAIVARPVGCTVCRRFYAPPPGLSIRVASIALRTVRTYSPSAYSNPRTARPVPVDAGGTAALRVGVVGVDLPPKLQPVICTTPISIGGRAGPGLCRVRPCLRCEGRGYCKETGTKALHVLLPISLTPRRAMIQWCIVCTWAGRPLLTSKLNSPDLRFPSCLRKLCAGMER
jgi:hypothetical protein